MVCNLIKKELTIIFSSLQTCIAGCLFLSILGMLLWFFPGSYNLFDGMYASLDSAFILLPFFLLFFVSALSMRGFSEEKKTGTNELLFTYPVSSVKIYLAKFLAVIVCSLCFLMLTAVYAVSIYFLGNPAGNLDIGIVLTSYAGLILLSCLFTAIGLFTSALTENQIGAYVGAVFMCLFLYWGFDLLATWIASSELQWNIQRLSIENHFQSFRNGMLKLNDCLYFVLMTLLFITMTLFRIAICERKRYGKYLILFVIVQLCFFIFQDSFNLKKDFTSDKKHTLTDFSKNTLKDMDFQARIVIYLDGDLDIDFLQLKEETRNVLNEMKQLAGKKITYSFFNPNYADDEVIRAKQRMSLLQRNMKDEILSETDNEGKLIQKSVFPWIDVIVENDTVPVSLLSANLGKSKSERINQSITELEFNIMNALHQLNQTEVKTIAFLEGHGELPEMYVYDAVNELSEYFDVFRGELNDSLAEIPPYHALIIANPTEKFTEKEKFLLDQYLMSGGNILFLINSAVVSYESLRTEGKSASIINEINLGDLLFYYGVRINPVLVQDLQCAYIPLKAGDSENYQRAPWYYAPLLNPAQSHSITKNIAPVKAEFAGSIDFVGNNEEIAKHILLTSSPYTHITSVPVLVSVDDASIRENSDYFDKQNIPVAVLLEGAFTSAFKGRISPTENKLIETGKTGRIIVAASGSIIRNEIKWTNEKEGIALPIGYDSYMDTQFGNRDFVVNAVNYLTGNSELMLLRNKETALNMLDKTKIRQEKEMWQWVNILLPNILLIFSFCAFNYVRKKKYGK